MNIGTSGWSYQHWVGPFYSEDLAKSQHFHFYSQKFSTVELNTTFYHLPINKTFVSWRDKAPEGFKFTVKASRYITHIKKMNEVAEPVSRLLNGCQLLGEKMGPLLFQLPPGLKRDLARLDGLLGLLPSEVKPVLEFRHPSWFEARVYDILAKHNAGFCWHDFKQMKCPQIVTGELAYIRLHGPDGHYTEKYSQEYLEKLAQRIREYQRSNFEVYVYFNNDYAGYAVENALSLKKFLVVDMT